MKTKTLALIAIGIIMLILTIHLATAFKFFGWEIGAAGIKKVEETDSPKLPTIISPPAAPTQNHDDTITWFVDKHNAYLPAQEFVTEMGYSSACFVAEESRFVVTAYFDENGRVQKTTEGTCEGPKIRVKEQKVKALIEVEDWKISHYMGKVRTPLNIKLKIIKIMLTN